MASINMKTFKQGAVRSIGGEAVGLTAGFALTRGFEEQVYCAFPKTFGRNTSQDALTQGQKRNRQFLLAGGVVLGSTGAIYFRSSNKPIAAACAGFAAGESWHLANTFGLNYDGKTAFCLADNFRSKEDVAKTTYRYQPAV